MLQSPFVLEITKKVATSCDIFARPTISSWIMGWVRISCPLWSWHPLAWKKWNSPSICRKIWGWMCGTPDRWQGQTFLDSWSSKMMEKPTYQFAWIFEKSWKRMGSLYRWFSMFLAFMHQRCVFWLNPPRWISMVEAGLKPWRNFPNSWSRGKCTSLKASNLESIGVQFVCLWCWDISLEGIPLQTSGRGV